MRLIDADDLLLYTNINECSYEPRINRYQIVTAPTVEAIPISVIEDIKAEIEEVRKSALGYPNWEYAKGLNKSIEIIDKHISGKEKECK